MQTIPQSDQLEAVRQLASCKIIKSQPLKLVLSTQLSSQQYVRSNEYINEQKVLQLFTGVLKNCRDQLNHNEQSVLEQQEVQCFNNLCPRRNSNLKKVSSKGCLRKHNIMLCEDCHFNYCQNHYCQYCEQIFSLNPKDRNYDDAKEWIQCEKCEKWNHMECEATYSNKNIQQEKDNSYFCQTCRNISNNNRQIKNKKEEKKKIPQQPQSVNSDSQKDDPFVYDLNFIKKIKRKPIDLQELEPKQKKMTPRISVSKIPDITVNHIQLTVSRDNKSQLNIKLMLQEEEIKQDLDLLRQLQDGILDDIQPSFEFQNEEKIEEITDVKVDKDSKSDSKPQTVERIQTSKKTNSKKSSPTNESLQPYLTRSQLTKKQNNEGVKTRKQNNQRL